nr:MAG: hypothetical protein [Bacteriophage sp.]
MSKMLIGNGVVTTDEVIKQGYDFVGLKMAGMLKVQEDTVEQDLTIKGADKYLPPGTVLPLVFTQDTPDKIWVAAGQAVNMEVVVSGGVAPYSYQWKKATVNVGGNQPSYSIPSAASGNSGTYTVTVTDAEGKSVTSTPCMVSVLAKKADVNGTIGTAVGTSTLFSYPASVGPTDLTLTANNGATVSAGNTSITPTARGVTTVTAKLGSSNSVTANITVTPVVTGKGDITGKKAGDVLSVADLFTLTNGAVAADITGVTGTDVTWNNTAKTLTIANPVTTPGADITLAFTVGSGVTKAGTLVLKAVAAAA